jgi:NAD(P)-dependent dehydrogenase (short-subunit alcohol dehydrogenase family)
MSSTWEAAPQRVRSLENIRWDFTGEVVLITGAAQGQGRSHALGFAGAGADLVICDLPAGAQLAGITYDLGNPAKLEQVAKECRAHGVRALPVTCDVRDSQQVESMVNSAIAEYGKIDILVNNAGVSGHNEVVDLPEDEWDDLVNTNLRGVFLCSKYVAREMIAARKARSSTRRRSWPSPRCRRALITLSRSTASRDCPRPWPSSSPHTESR